MTDRNELMAEFSGARKPKPFTNKLTQAELERLAILAEECAEVQQVIGKIIRHGYESYNPFDEAKTTNRELLEKELGHVEFITRLMMNSNDMTRFGIVRSCDNKEESIKPYLHHQ